MLRNSKFSCETSLLREVGSTHKDKAHRMKEETAAAANITTLRLKVLHQRLLEIQCRHACMRTHSAVVKIVVTTLYRHVVRTQNLRRKTYAIKLYPIVQALWS